MNFMNLNIVRNAFISSFILTATLGSCSDDNDGSEVKNNNYNNPEVSILVSTPCVGESQVEELSRSSQKSSTEIIAINDELVIETILERSPDVFSRAATKVEAGIKYRIVAYKKGNITPDGYINHADFVAGSESETNFHLPENCDYDLICFSSGTTDLPEFSKEASDLTVDLTSNKDPMWQKVPGIHVGGTTTPLSFTFRHCASRVNLVITSTSGEITGCQARIVPYYENAQLSLADGSLSKKSTTSGSSYFTLDGLNTTRVTSHSPELIFTHGETFILNIQNIIIGGTTITNRSFAFSDKEVEYGKSYTLKVNFLKTEGIQIGDRSWAPGNLVKTGDVYKFYSSQEGKSKVWNGGDYWGWNILDPLDYKTIASSWNDNNDPCQKVNPAGYWKTPSTADLKSLGTPVVGTLNGVSGLYFQNKKIFLPYCGTRQGATQTLQATSVAYYWTRDASGSSATYLYCYSPTVLFLTAVDRSYGLNIRCVRIKN